MQTEKTDKKRTSVMETSKIQNAVEIYTKTNLINADGTHASSGGKSVKKNLNQRRLA